MADPVLSEIVDGIFDLGECDALGIRQILETPRPVRGPWSLKQLAMKIQFEKALKSEELEKISNDVLARSTLMFSNVHWFEGNNRILRTILSTTWPASNFAPGFIIRDGLCVIAERNKPIATIRIGESLEWLNSFIELVIQLNLPSFRISIPDASASETQDKKMERIVDFIDKAFKLTREARYSKITVCDFHCYYERVVPMDDQWGCHVYYKKMIEEGVCGDSRH